MKPFIKFTSSIPQMISLKGKFSLLKITILLLFVFGIAAGVILVQQEQEIREKAQTITCDSSYVGACGTGVLNDCPPGYICEAGSGGYFCSKNTDCDFPLCTSTDCWQLSWSDDGRCPATLKSSGAVDCIAAGAGQKSHCCCPANKPLIQNNSQGKPVCVTSNGGGGGGGGTGGQCGIGSAASCQGQSPGDSCTNNGTCKDTGQVDKNGNPNCSCSGQDGGGGGGNGDECTDAKPNPSTITVNKDGKLVVYYNVVGGTIQLAVKRGSSSCSLTDNDGVFDLADNANGMVETGLDVTAGQEICVGVYYQNSDQASWNDANGNTCEGLDGDLDITPNVTQAETDYGVGSVVVKQCWDNEVATCDFNDFALVFAVSGSAPPPPTGGMSLLVRFQGIVKKALDQKITTILLRDGTQVYRQDDVSVNNNDDGIYTVNIGNLAAGTYSLLVKGHSHLQRRFTNVVYNGGNQVIDLSTEEDYQLRAGDVNDDNAITIEDVSQVLSYYNDFINPVDTNNPGMVASDVDKNGQVTIQDVALIAINWSDFRVEGDR